MDSQEFKHLGYEMIDWIADYLENGYQEGPVFPNVAPGNTLAQLPANPPQYPEPGSALFNDFKSIIVPGLTHWNDPRFFGYFPCNNSAPSVLAELLAAGVGVNTFSWITSPAATELEIRMMEWLGQMIGLEWKGVIQDTASSATLCALLSAREAMTGINFTGFAGQNQTLRVYVSDQTHSSVLKAGRVAGFGDANVVTLKTDASCTMNPQLLEDAFKADLAQGLTPCFVVATVGTTSSTAIDPVEAIAEICKRYGVWLHVDAALAGTAALLPEMRWLMTGVPQADSFLFNPHKWMFTNFDCCAYFCKDPLALKKAMALTPEYLKTQHDLAAENLRDWGLQLGRRFRALKLWFVIRSYGVEGLQQKIRLHLQMAKEFATLIGTHSHFHLIQEPVLNTVCFKLDTDALGEALLAAVNASGEAFLTHTRIEGCYVIRVSFGQTGAKVEDVARLWATLNRCL